MIIPRTTLTIALLLIAQLTACSDTGNNTREVKAAKQERMFDSQRKTLEQAKAVADFANQRGQQHERQSQEFDNGKH